MVEEKSEETKPKFRELPSHIKEIKKEEQEEEEFDEDEEELEEESGEYTDNYGYPGYGYGPGSILRDSGKTQKPGEELEAIAQQAPSAQTEENVVYEKKKSYVAGGKYTSDADKYKGKERTPENAPASVERPQTMIDAPTTVFQPHQADSHGYPQQQQQGERDFVQYHSALEDASKPEEKKDRRNEEIRY